MGNKESKEITLKTSELNEFHNMTLFPNDVLIKLHDHYRHFSSIQTDDGVIDFNEFYTLMNKNERILTKRIFNAIDSNKDGCINFREFIKFISCFINGSLDEQITLSYKLFSSPEKRCIEKEIIYVLLKEVVKSENALYSFLTNDILEELVTNTFNQYANESGVINYDRYKELVRKNPDILNWLKVDIERIKKAKADDNTKKQNKKSWCS
jgi:Ca2+-binding EF-hand superfamily protein